MRETRIRNIDMIDKEEGQTVSDNAKIKIIPRQTRGEEDKNSNIKQIKIIKTITSNRGARDPQPEYKDDKNIEEKDRNMKNQNKVNKNKTNKRIFTDSESEIPEGKIQIDDIED